MSPFPFLNNHFNIIFPSMLRCAKWSLSLKFPHQNPVCTSPLPHTCCMSNPFYPSWFDHLNNICWAVQIIKLIVMYSSPLPCCLLCLRPKYLPSSSLMMYISIWDYTTKTESNKYYLTRCYNTRMVMKYFLFKRILEPPSGKIWGSQMILLGEYPRI